MKRRSNRFLMWALAISLAAHAVFIYWGQSLTVGSADPVETPHPFRFDPRRPTPPPPSPIVTPKPVAQPRRAQTSQPRVTTPPTATDSRVGPVAPPGPTVTGGPVTGPDIGPTGPPEPTAAPTVACTAPDIAAHALNAITPETPRLAQEEGLTGTAQVKVSIDAAGSVTDVSIYRSSGSSLLDTAALNAAKESTYKADIRNCEAVPGSYLFTVVFQ